jgi:hypothetical protein
LTGDWNINFLQDSLHVREINNILIRYNLINTVKVPTRITKTSSSLLDVIIIHEEKLLEPARVMELGMSDHYAQILSIPIKTHSIRSYKVFERELNEENMQEFLYLLQQESWQDVYREVDANTKFNKFLDNFIHYYDIAFPIRLIPKREAIRKHWITQGIKNSS